MTKIRVEGLFKGFAERRGSKRAASSDGGPGLVLRDVGFEIEAGHFTCFVGPSGCGKSTLLRIIAGFDQADQGHVLINGTEQEGPSSSQIFVFQEDGLFPWMNAYENVALGARHIKDPAEQEHQVLEYLDLVGLKGFERHYPHELSGGMRRRAEVARALITNPDILFMDEPFSALDFVTRLQMREEMVNVHAMFQSTILFITHDIDEALQLGDQIIVLGERPSSVKADLELSLPHPRDITQGRLAALRKEIYFLMGLHAAL